MREITTAPIIEAIEKMCIDANCFLCKDVQGALEKSYETEASPIGKNVLKTLLENADIARHDQVPMCQDTGMAVVFVEIGQEVMVTGGSLAEAIHEGVRRGYEKGYLRKSVVGDPIQRVNTGDNTPAVIHYDIVPGDRLKLTVSPKGFGSENMSALKMLKPSDGIEGVQKFVLDTVTQAGPNPCPPIIVGIGIGGTMEKAALLSKRSLLRELGTSNPNTYWKEMEQTLLGKINQLGIGPSGLGGTTTALGVHIETYPTHIAGLPVAVNISCNATRHVETIL